MAGFLRLPWLEAVDVDDHLGKSLEGLLGQVLPVPMSTRAGALAGVGQRGQPVPGHRPDGDTLTG
jgi:hypothetical protein